MVLLQGTKGNWMGYVKTGHGGISPTAGTESNHLLRQDDTLLPTPRRVLVTFYVFLSLFTYLYFEMKLSNYLNVVYSVIIANDFSCKMSNVFICHIE